MLLLRNIEMHFSEYHDTYGIYIDRRMVNLHNAGEQPRTKCTSREEENDALIFHPISVSLLISHLLSIARHDQQITENTQRVLVASSLHSSLQSPSTDADHLGKSF